VRYILIFVVVLLVVVTSNALAVQRTVSWDRVTTYTDGTLVELVKIVYYDITKRTQGGVDNILIVNNITNNSAVFEQTNDGNIYIFNGRARLSTGEVSVWSPDFVWQASFPWSLPIAIGPPIMFQITK
jgi:hypothetical protein